MVLRNWTRKIFDLLRPGLRSGHSAFARARGQITHVLVLAHEIWSVQVVDLDDTTLWITGDDLSSGLDLGNKAVQFVTHVCTFNILFELLIPVCLFLSDPSFTHSSTTIELSFEHVTTLLILHLTISMWLILQEGTLILITHLIHKLAFLSLAFDKLTVIVNFTFIIGH